MGAPEKETISEGVEGCLRRFFSRGGGGGAYRGFFPGGLSKIGELLIKKNRFSVEQAFSYFTITGVQNKYFLRE